MSLPLDISDMSNCSYNLCIHLGWFLYVTFFEVNTGPKGMTGFKHLGQELPNYPLEDFTSCHSHQQVVRVTTGRFGEHPRCLSGFTRYWKSQRTLWRFWDRPGAEDHRCLLPSAAHTGWLCHSRWRSPEDPLGLTQHPGCHPGHSSPGGHRAETSLRPGLGAQQLPGPDRP